MVFRDILQCIFRDFNVKCSLEVFRSFLSRGIGRFLDIYYRQCIFRDLSVKCNLEKFRRFLEIFYNVFLGILM